MERYYFDHNATTPLAPEVLAVLTETLRDCYGNASSIHSFGQQARKRLETAREQTAALLGCDAGEVVFTSGGTEGDNLAVLGAVRAAGDRRRHVITSAIEHPAVLAACGQLEQEGVEVTVLPVDGRGLVDPDDLRRALRPHTVLVTVMHANNETGAIQPIAELARIAREAGVLVHSDGVQAAGKIAAPVRKLGVDLYSISGHKIYGPKGVGALWVRKDTRLAPLLFGGRAENGYRPGTHAVTTAIALGAAAEWKTRHMAEEAHELERLRDRLEQAILDRVPATGVNGAGASRAANTSNIWFDGVEGEAMVIALDLRGFAVSTGAACSSGAVEPSHVLTAMGLPRERAKASLRFSLGLGNTEAQVDALVEAVAESALRLRQVSATFEVHA